MNGKHYEWNPINILNGKNNSNNDKSQYAVVILNTKIRWKPKFLLPLWNKALLRVTVDGGTNHWFEWLRENHIGYDTVPYPHFVTGDMDSIDVKLLEMMRKRNSNSIILTEDQNETDFTKALREIDKAAKKTATKIEIIVVVADSCGRLDQIMANINTLFVAKVICPNVNIFQLTNDSLSWLLWNGKHKIHIPDALRQMHTWCALIPIGEQCDHITTTGLKWNITNMTLKFGELVSTSNTYSGDQTYVTIETEKTLLWSMGLDGIPFSQGNL